MQQQLNFSTEDKLVLDSTSFVITGTVSGDVNALYYELPNALKHSASNTHMVSFDCRAGYLVPYVLQVDELGILATLCHKYKCHLHVLINGKLYKVQCPKGIAHMYFVGNLQGSFPSAKTFISLSINERHYILR